MLLRLRSYPISSSLRAETPSIISSYSRSLVYILYFYLLIPPGTGLVLLFLLLFLPVLKTLYNPSLRCRSRPLCILFPLLLVAESFSDSLSLIRRRRSSNADAWINLFIPFRDGGRDRNFSADPRWVSTIVTRFEQDWNCYYCYQFFAWLDSTLVWVILEGMFVCLIFEGKRTVDFV